MYEGSSPLFVNAINVLISGMALRRLEPSAFRNDTGWLYLPDAAVRYRPGTPQLLGDAHRRRCPTEAVDSGLR